MDATILTCGETAVLVEVADLDAVMALDHAVRNRLTNRQGPWRDVVEVVPATRTVLVTASSAAGLPALRDEIEGLVAELDPTPPEMSDSRTVTIGVHYDGPDLAEVASLTGLSEPEVIEAHTGTPWRVAFCGFAPGFPYLVGGDPRLEVPRRAEPRTHVPAGAVGLAGTFSGVYPRVSPGGWQLLGHTDDVMWDLDRDPPALATPGDVVRFVDLGAEPRGESEPAEETASRDGVEPETTAPDGAETAEAPEAAGANEAPGAAGTTSARVGTPPFPTEGTPKVRIPGSRHLTVLATGPLSVLTDEGRRGVAHLGVSASGAADRASYELGQRLLEQYDGSAAIEVTYGGLTLRSEAVFTMVLTGADAHATLDGQGVGMNAPFFVFPGQPLTLGHPQAGLRTYVAVRGGFDTEPVLGSRSTDVLSGIGPRQLKAGDVLTVASATTLAFAGVDQAPVWPLSDGSIEVEVVPGPRDDWFARPDDLLGTWTVSQKSNRVGVRLEGGQIARHHAHEGELPTEGMVRGSVQVPPSGEPVVFLADHPVTGGYPVIGVATPRSVDRLAQAVPGQQIVFRWKRH